MEHSADIKFGDLGANTAWLTFSLANQPMQLVRYTADYWLTGLKPGRVIRVNRVTFSPGHPGLTRFIKYPGLTRIDCTIRVFRSFGAWITHS